MLSLLILFLLQNTVPAAPDHLIPADEVNPFIGTDGHGHTYPGASAPFGMVQLSPDTRVEGWDACAGYHYSDRSILGFSHTHLSGTGIADYGDILFSPTSGIVRWNTGDPDLPGSGYRSRFDHRNESAGPGHYSVFLDDFGITVELTATPRVGVHRYSFPGDETGNLIVNLLHGLGPDKVTESWIRVLNRREFQGFRRSSGWANDQHLYFHAILSRPADSSGLILDDDPATATDFISGTNVKAFFRFLPDSLHQILVKVGLSTVSAENARANVLSEVPDWDFDAVRRSMLSSWNHKLGKIEVDGGTEEQRRTFYTALYHSMLAPNIQSDSDGRYRGMDGRIHTTDGFDMYTVFSLWDTFRAEHPLLTIIDRERTGDFVHSLLEKYRQSGTLPVWELASNETWTMIGYHSVPVILDAYVKDIRPFDPREALAAMKASAMNDRFGLKAYREFGYIPGDREGESVSKTLEYAYNDWCIAEMARRIGAVDDAEDFAGRALSYRNIFDPRTALMRPKMNSTWLEPFDPASVTFHYTEANSWQYSFFALHDVDGLIRLMGGKERFIAKLDSLFNAPPDLTGRKQPDITGLIGQYAHGNEPSHHVAYLYNYAGAPWKTQRLVRQIMDSLYSDQPDGLSGNEDCGQMSAWYVLSAIGLYQVCPGDPVYALGSPLFSRVVLNLENGNRFVIRAPQTDAGLIYVQRADLNSIPVTVPFIGHDDIMNGGDIIFAMSNIPGSAPMISGLQADTGDNFVSIPAAYASGANFTDSMTVSLGAATQRTEIFYTTDGSKAGPHARRYSEPLILRKTTTIRAVAVSESGISSREVEARFAQYEPIGTIRSISGYSEQYTGGGDYALIDQRRGEADWRLGAWQGYEGVDLNVVIDLGSIRTVRRVALGCLQDQNAWIFFPQSVEFSFSKDRKRYGNVFSVENPVSAREEGAILKEFGGALDQVRARYVRVLARSIGRCPDWHKGAGGKAWIFADEILVETEE